MKQFMGLALMLVAFGSHAEDLYLVCAVHGVSVEHPTDADRYERVYTISNKGTRIRMNNSAKTSPLNTTAQSYAWDTVLATSPGEPGITVKEEISRISGKYTLTLVGTHRSLTTIGTCQKGEPKF